LSTPYPKFQNDGGIAEIRIGTREFHCVGATPPQDHPHVYLNMGERDALACPYCGTIYRFDGQLATSTSLPPEAAYVES